MHRTRALLFATGVVLTGCQSTPTGNGTVNEAQGIAKNLCLFVPTAKTILEILELGIPHLSKAAQIAEAICSKVGDPRSGGGTLKNAEIEGVKIKGEFVRP